ncbi:MAG: hypothetical protein ACR2OE_00310 [Thermomicrobiales bacterium]
MNYSLKTAADLRSLRNRFLATLASDRLNSTNRVNIERWISEIETALIAKATPVKVAKPVTARAPSIRAMRNGSAAPRNAADVNRLQMSYLS